MEADNFKPVMLSIVKSRPLYRPGLPGEQFELMIRDQFDVLYEESQLRPKMLSSALHPFLSGRPHRAKYLDQALKYATSHHAVYFATGGEIVASYLEHASEES